MAIDLEIPSKRAQSVYPLTSMQQNMLAYSQFMRQPGLDIEQVIADLHEALDVMAFEKAWKQIFRRHAVLRTSFREAAKSQQEVHEHLDLDFVYEDWKDLSSTEQKQKYAGWLAEDRQRGFDPETPPLMRVALIRLKKAHYRFVWTFHHLLLDATAFTIVLKEAFAFYEAMHEGYELGLGEPVSFRSYVRWLQNFGEDKSFWREALKGFEAPTPLVIARSSARTLGGDEPTYGEQCIRLSEEETLALKSAAQTLAVTQSTMVEAAWGLLLGRYSGQEDVVFGGVRACRNSSFPGAKSVVGLLINTVPVRVRINPGATVGEWLQSFRREQ